MKKTSAICLALLMLGVFSAVRAQQAASNLEGTVKDEQGNALPGVEIVAKDTRTGITRASVSGPLGRFRVTALAPSLYDVTFKLAGFKTKTMTGLELFVNETKVLNATMDPAAVEEHVTVVAESPIIESTKSEVSTVVTTREVDSLPLLTRQFANLALLAPGTTEMTSSYDPTKTRMSQFSAGGFRSRAVYYSVDGADNKDNMVGGPVQLFTTEGVEEFSVATHQFKAEYGRTQGTVVTVLTKSGTNELSGSVFGFFRDASLRAMSYLEKVVKADNPESWTGKPPFHRQNFGFSLGGPIAKDRTHFFVAYERVQEKSFTVVNTDGHWPSFEGTFPYPFSENLVTINLTHQLSPRHSLKLRYGFQYNKTENEGVGLDYTVDNGYRMKNTNHNLMLADSWIIQPNILNEARAVYQYFDNRSDPNSTSPTHYYSYGAFGQTTNMPQETRQTKLQFRDDLSYHVSDWAGTHDFKFGADYYYMPRLDLLYANYQQWLFTHVTNTYGANPGEGPIRRIQIMGGDPWRYQDKRYDSIGLYAQDDWRVTDKLTLNLGVRWDYNTGLEFDQSVLGSVQFLANYIPGFQNPGLKHDGNNIAPRLGFAYDLNGDGKTVFRGGFGIFYDQLYAETFMYAAAWLGANPWHTVFYHSQSTAILNPDGSIWQPVFDASGNLTNLAGISNQVTPGVVDSAIGPEFQYPYSYHYNLGFSHQISANFAIDVNYVHTETRGLGKGDELNRYHPNADNYTLSDSYGSTIWTPRFVGMGYYNGLYISLRKRFSNQFELRVNYTLSGGMSTLNYRGADGWGVTCIDEGQPNSPKEWGPIDTDERHRLFVAGITQLPFGFEFSTMIRWNSPRPYDITAGIDLNDDDYYNDLPGDIPHRMDGRATDNFFQMDFRLSKTINFNKRMDLEFMFEVFNAFNTTNLTGYVGDRTDPNFGLPTDATMPREAQLGVRFRF